MKIVIGFSSFVRYCPYDEHHKKKKKKKNFEPNEETGYNLLQKGDTLGGSSLSLSP